MERQLLADAGKLGFNTFQHVGEDTFGSIYRCIEEPSKQMLLSSHLKSRERMVRISKANADKAIPLAQLMQEMKKQAKDNIFVPPVVSHHRLLDRYMIVQEWYEYSLVDAVRKLGLLMIQKKHICYGIIQGILAGHKQGFTHGFLTYSSFRLNLTYCPKIIDWFLQTEDDIKDFHMFYAPDRFYHEVSGKVDAFANDVWAVGLILYFVLTGRDGFSKQKLKSYEEMKTIEAKLIFRSGDDVPELAQTLVRSLVSPNPASRMTLEKAANHEWFHDIKTLNIQMGSFSSMKESEIQSSKKA